ncbi:class II aldolase/adducin family protein [Herbaspirillum lusitanum]|uniref:Class II aldolase/adducin family protein n=1 Tax=Herbaspirillum lusitanum TaxID=213312 RepID=A0ABW9ACP5_9BURK
MRSETESGNRSVEANARLELATLYRMLAHFRMSDLIDTHISSRVPGTSDHFLINAYGVLFHEMSPDKLVKIDSSGQVLQESGKQSMRINRAGFVIHSAVHNARHDLSCVIHTHTPDGIAVACEKSGLLPISQHALKFYKRIGYHDYEGIALDLDERSRLVANLGGHQAMILRNHGLLVAGRTVAEAFLNLMYLERACQIQMKLTARQSDMIFPTAEVCERTARQYEEAEGLEHADLVWQSMRRLLN